jgi:twitching motility protein PilT
MTGRVRDMINDPAQTGRLHEVIQEGEYYGMQTFDQALLGHLQAGRINMEEALKASTHPHDFKLLVAAEGRRSTSMADVAPRQDGDADDSASVSTNGNGAPHSEPAGPPPSQPAPVTPLTPVTPAGEPDDPPPPPPPPAAVEEAPATTGSVPPPGVA